MNTSPIWQLNLKALSCFRQPNQATEHIKAKETDRHLLKLREMKLKIQLYQQDTKHINTCKRLLKKLSARKLHRRSTRCERKSNILIQYNPSISVVMGQNLPSIGCNTFIQETSSPGLSPRRTHNIYKIIIETLCVVITTSGIAKVK